MWAERILVLYNCRVSNLSSLGTYATPPSPELSHIDTKKALCHYGIRPEKLSPSAGEADQVAHNAQKTPKQVIKMKDRAESGRN